MSEKGGRVHDRTGSQDPSFPRCPTPCPPGWRHRPGGLEELPERVSFDRWSAGSRRLTHASCRPSRTLCSARPAGTGRGVPHRGAQLSGRCAVHRRQARVWWLVSEWPSMVAIWEICVPVAERCHAMSCRAGSRATTPRGEGHPGGGTADRSGPAEHPIVSARVGRARTSDAVGRLGNRTRPGPAGCAPSAEAAHRVIWVDQDRAGRTA